MRISSSNIQLFLVFLITLYAEYTRAQCPTSAFSGTFTPTNGQIMSGTYNISGIFFLPQGDTIWVEPYALNNCGSLEIYADSVRIEGVIMAIGSGMPGGIGGAAGLCVDSARFQDCSLASQCLAVPAVIGALSGLPGNGVAFGLGGTNATNGRGRKNSCNATSDRVGRIGGSGGGGGGGGGSYGGNASSGGNGTGGTIPVASANSPDNPCSPASSTPIQAGNGGIGGGITPGYGTMTGPDIDMGSGGAGGGGGGRGFIWGQNGGNGGNGGGRIIIQSTYGLFISGDILASGGVGGAGGKGGDSGESDRCCIDACPQVNEHTYVGSGGGGGGAGGGSGGGILIQSSGNITITGLLDVSGGQGGNGGLGGLNGFWSYQEPPFICGSPGGILTSITTAGATSGQQGGNGGGGRIKIFYDNCGITNISPMIDTLSGGVGAFAGSYWTQALSTSPPIAGNVISANNPQTFCSGTPGDTLFALNISPYFTPSYQWQYQSDCIGAWLNVPNATLPYWIPIGLTDTACVRLFVTYGLCSTIYNDTTFIQVTPAPSGFSIQNSNPIFCSGGSSTLSLSPMPPAGTSYQWYINNSPILPGAGGTNSSLLVNTAGNYTATLNLPGAFCPALSDTTTITIFPNPSAQINAQNNATVFCSGGVGITLSAGGIPGGSYQWLWNQTPVGANTTSYTANTAGNYQVVVTDGNGCVDTSVIWGISIFNTPIASIGVSPFHISQNNNQMCAGDTATLSDIGGSAASQWYHNGNFLGSNQPTINATTGGVYDLIVTDGPGCADTVSFSLNVVPLPIPALVVSSTAFCPGDSVLLVASGGGNYLWDNGSIQDSFYVNQTGTYCVSVFEPILGCSDSICSPTITLSSNVNATLFNLGNTTICQGDTTWLQAGGGGSYQWLLNNIPISGVSSPLYGATVSGNYSVIATLGSSCSDTSGIVSVNVQNVIPASLSVVGQNPVCEGDTVFLQASGSGNYVWIVPPGAAASNAPTYLATVSGNYQVISLNLNGNCPDSSTSITVNINPIPVPIIGLLSGSNPTCEGDSITLGCGNYNTYQWYENGSPMSTGQSLTIGNTGTIMVSVTDNNGCEGTSANYSVITLPSPQPTISGSNLLCAGGSVTLQSAVSGNGTWQWFNQNGGQVIPGAVNATLVVTQADGYVVSFIDNTGCIGSSALFNVSMSSGINVSITPSDSISFCENDPLGAVIYAAGGDTYQWYRNNLPLNGQTSDSLIVTSAGSHWVIGESTSGCKDTSEVLICSIRPQPLAQIILSGSPLICKGKSIRLYSVQDSVVTWLKEGVPLSTLPVMDSLTVNEPGVYGLIVANLCGNDTSSLPILVENIPFEADFIYEPEYDLYINRMIHFREQCDNGTVSWHWDFGIGGVSTSSLPNPYYQYPTADTFMVSLAAENQEGCRDTIYKNLIIYDKGDFYIPSIFSPNADGYNDIFSVNGNNISMLIVKIFDRNGREIHQLNSITDVWNGTYKNIDVPEGVYTFTYSVTYINGKKTEGSGNVTLIR